MTYATAITTLPGFNFVGGFVSRKDLETRFPTKAQASAWAEDRANFGAPASSRYAVLVCKKAPGRGWKVISQWDVETWEETWEEDQGQ